MKTAEQTVNEYCEYFGNAKVIHADKAVELMEDHLSKQLHELNSTLESIREQRDMFRDKSIDLEKLFEQRNEQLLDQGIKIGIITGDLNAVSELVATLQGQVVDITYERDEFDEANKKLGSQIRRIKFVLFAEDVSVFDKVQCIQKIFINE